MAEGSEMSRSMPSEALFASVMDEVPGAMDRLLEAWLPVVIAWCGRFGGPRVNREDAAHDVLIVVIKNWRRVESPAKFRPWLFSVMRNVTSRHRSWAWVRRWVPGDLPEQADPYSTLRTEYSDTSRWVWEVLDNLPAKQREVVLLCDLEGWTREEVATLLGISSGTVKGRLRLGREKFRRIAHARGHSPGEAGVG